MNPTTQSVTDDDLHAHADGRLSASRRAEVEAWLAQCPEDAARAAFYARLNTELHRQFDPVLSEPVPGAMARPGARRRTRLLARTAAAAAWLAVGLAAGWTGHGYWTGSAIFPNGNRVASAAAPLPRQAALAHAVFAVEVRHPVEVGIDEEAHLVRWLSNRIGRQIKAPRLDPRGYRLMGGRLLPAAEGGVAIQFMYEAANGQRVTLFYKMVNEGPAETAFQFVTESNGVNVFYWREDRMGYALSGNQPRDELLRLARAVYQQVSD